MEIRDYEPLEILEKNYFELENLDPQTLIEIIKAQRKKLDKLENIKRTTSGEEIIQDDEIVKDEEEYL